MGVGLGDRDSVELGPEVVVNLDSGGWSTRQCCETGSG